MNRPMIQPGDVIRGPPQYYRHGTGELRMRVTYVPKSSRIPGLEWIELVGITVTDDGRPGRPQQVLVRVAALRVPGRVIRPPAPPLPQAPIPRQRW